MAFSAREDKKVDKRSGVSQRLPISTLELGASNAGSGALVTGDAAALPRVSDMTRPCPASRANWNSSTRARCAARIRWCSKRSATAAGKIFDRYFAGVETREIEKWFNLGGTVKLDDNQPAAAALRYEGDSGTPGKAVAAGRETS